MLRQLSILWMPPVSNGRSMTDKKKHSQTENNTWKIKMLLLFYFMLGLNNYKMYSILSRKSMK